METQHECQIPISPGQQGVESNSFIQVPTEQTNFKELNDKELQVLVTLAISAFCYRGISVSSLVPPAPKTPDIFDDANFEQIACAGLGPKDNGSLDELIPTLKAINIRCQNEV